MSAALSIRAPSRFAQFIATSSGQLVTRLIVLTLLLAAWQFLPSPALRFWVSGPIDIVSRLYDWVLDGSLWDNLAATLAAMALGYAIGTATGVALGLLFGFLPTLHRVLSPYISALYALPKIALAPLFVIVLGIGLASKIALVALTVFFLVLTATLDGVRNVDRDLARTLVLMGATRAEIVRKVLVPAALPWIFTGMRIAVRYAFTNTLLAELIASNRGIGSLIEYYSGTFDAAGAYAAILVLVICSVGLTELLSRVEARMARRSHS